MNVFMKKATRKRKPYVQKIGEISTHSVWLVDGAYIRKKLDENFAVCDSHIHLPFIPKYELWIENGTNPAEWYFFTYYLLQTKAAVARGCTPREAMARADELEKELRDRVWVAEHGEHALLRNKEQIEKVHRKRYEKYGGSVAVWLVDGMMVRDIFSTEYTDGGHDRVYPYIPKHEIWIEETLDEKEIPFILLHELHERYLMGEGKDYPHAHAGATQIEDRYRHNPALLDERIREEMKKNDLQDA